MLKWVLIIAGAVAFLAWDIMWASWLERTLPPWLGCRVRGSARRAALLAAGFQTGALLACAALGSTGIAIGHAVGDHRWGALLVVPACVFYAPVLLYFMPNGATSFRTGIRTMENAGLTQSQARAFLWTGHSFTYAGMLVIALLFFFTFAAGA